MANETRFLSRIVRTQIPEYNKYILNNMAVIEDDFLCDWCPIWCPSILIIGCAVACFFTVTTGCYFCAMYGTYLSMGCDAACLAVCAAEEGNDYPFYVSSIAYTGGYGSYAVNNPSNLIGPNSDGASVHLHASNYGDTAQIIGELNAVASGDIYIYGCSGSGGYYSDLYVYVSYDYNSWDLVSVQTITATSPYSIYIGEASNFRYIAITGYDSGNSVCLYLDAVSVDS